MTLARDDGEKVSYGEEEASMKHHQAADQYQVLYQYQYQYQYQHYTNTNTNTR